MPPLSDISADCEKHESRMDGAHNKVDRLSPGEGGKGDSGTGIKVKPEPNGRKPFSTSKALVTGAVLAASAIVLAAITVIWVMGQEESPTDVYREYVDASNDRDIRRMFDQTVTRFTVDYDDRLANLSQVVFFLDPEIEILDAHVTYRANLTPAHFLAAEAIIYDVESRLDVEVDDYCYVGYEVNIDYRDIDQMATFNGEVLCVKIDGSWLLAIPGFF